MVLDKNHNKSIGYIIGIKYVYTLSYGFYIALTHSLTHSLTHLLTDLTCSPLSKVHSIRLLRPEGSGPFNTDLSGLFVSEIQEKKGGENG